MKQQLILEIDLDNVHVSGDEFEKEISFLLDKLLEKEQRPETFGQLLGKHLASQEISLDLVLMIAGNKFQEIAKQILPLRAIMNLNKENGHDK